MRRVFIALVIASAIFILRTNTVSSEDFRLEYNFAKPPKANALSTENLHAAYYGINTAIDKALGYEEGTETAFMERFLVELFKLPIPLGLSVLGHEGYHEWVCEENSGGEAHIEWKLGNLWKEETRCKGYLEPSEEARFYSAGFDWMNKAADETIERNMGQLITMRENVWFFLNQTYTALYMLKSDKPEGPLDPENIDDVYNWNSCIAGNNQQLRDKLYDDTKLGGIVNILGSIPPTCYGLYYLFTGKRYELPSLWFNTQAFLMDAGVMYTLKLYKLFGDILLQTQIGYGKDRVEGDDMHSAELEVSGIPLFWGIKGGFILGISDTLETNHVYGFSFEKKTSEHIALGIDMNYYDGYNPDNPFPKEDFNEVIFRVGFEL